MVEDGAQAQMPTNIWEEACTCKLLAFSSEQKLSQYFTVEEAKKKSKPQEKKRNVNGLKLFPDTAFWRQLYPDSTTVQEPANPAFCIVRGLTISEKDAGHVPKKYNFTDDILPFIGMKKSCCLTAEVS